jgi:arylsulfatase A-like enzyme
MSGVRTHPARRSRIAALCLLGALALASGGGVPSDERPSFIIVLADDLGWNDVGWHGSEIRTPELDRLAASGVRLERFYVHATCTPTRAALLTGRFAFRYGLQSAVVRPWEGHGLPEHERTLAEALRESGYRTALVGKWHLGIARPELLPTRRGFDHQYGPYLGSTNHWTHRVMGALDWHRDDRALVEQGYATDLIAREAVRLIREHDTRRPLFLLVAFTAPHAPLQAPGDDGSAYSNLEEPRRTYARMVTSLDQAVGAIDRALGERGLRERTLLFFASDNGADGSRGGSNAPLRGDKASLYEGGLRVPAFAAWPGRLPAGALRDEPLHAVDLHPTLLGLAGRPADATRRIDGEDVWRHLSAGVPLGRQVLPLHVEPNRGALLDGGWKLVLNGARPEEGEDEVPPDRRVLELYRPSEDPAEAHDLASAEPERVTTLLERWKGLSALAPPALGTYLRDPPPGFEPPRVWGAGPNPVGSAR